MKIIMKIYTDDERLIMITLPKTVRVDLSIKINRHLKQDKKFIARRNEYLPEYTIKSKIIQLLFNYKRKTIDKITELSIRKFNLIIKQW